MNFNVGLVLLIGLAAGCQSVTPGPDAAELLVTFEARPFSEVQLGGSKRGYHGGEQWPVSLHVRQAVRQVEKAYGLTRQDAWPIESLELFCVVFSVPDHRDIETLVQALQLDRRVADAQPMNEFEGMLS